MCDGGVPVWDGGLPEALGGLPESVGGLPEASGEFPERNGGTPMRDRGVPLRVGEVGHRDPKPGAGDWRYGLLPMRSAIRQTSCVVWLETVWSGILRASGPLHIPKRADFSATSRLQLPPPMKIWSYSLWPHSDFLSESPSDSVADSL